MSVELDSKDGKVEETISNGAWNVIVQVANWRDKSVPLWDGCHDGQEWTPEHLKVMAEALEDYAKFIPILRQLAEGGGVVIS